MGSIYTMIVKEYNEDFAKELKKKGASLIEPVEISLEQLFVVLEETKGIQKEQENDSDKAR